MIDLPRPMMILTPTMYVYYLHSIPIGMLAAPVQPNSMVLIASFSDRMPWRRDTTNHDHMCEQTEKYNPLPQPF
jgi:hypothetical protein